MRWPLLLLVTTPLLATQTIDLAGSWERWIADVRLDSVAVPSSYRPVGTAKLRHNFDLPSHRDQRVLLRFEGVAHQAKVRVGGVDVGSMGPWTPYRFDITEAVRPGSNTVEVEVTDWQVPLGPSGAWEAYGGIIRSASIELRPKTYVDNARLDYTLSSGLDAAQCNLTVFIQSKGPSKGRLTVHLLNGNAMAIQRTMDVDAPDGASSPQVAFQVPGPALWSPGKPNLYQLRVRFESADGIDDFTQPVGFRSLRVENSRFVLNGETLILRGVCRHDLWENQGHTLTQAQIDQDLEMIKSMGANFVRLVHYPHDPRVLASAARLGLLVTEESGLVWLQFRGANPQTVETGLQNLERVVRRDWNNPAFFAVLVANESPITPEVIRQARQRVHTLKKDLLVSTARLDSPLATLEDSKKLMDEGEVDFYCYHPYTFDMSDFEKVATIFTGKPLVFSEWGGRAIGDSPVMMQATTSRIGGLIESGRVSGHAFWSWADLPEFSREGEENKGGILVSGVVTESRVIRPGVYSSLTELFRIVPRDPDPPVRKPEVLVPVTAPLSSASRFTRVSLQSLVTDPSQRKAWDALESTMQEFFAFQGFTSRHWEETGKRFWTWSAAQLRIGPFPFQTPEREGETEPVVLNSSRPEIRIPIDATADRLLVLGNVTVPDGYPVIGNIRSTVGRYTVVYADGERQPVELRWGENVSRSNLIAVASRINPVTAHGERVILFPKDPVREVYQTRLLAIPTKPKRIRALECVFRPPAEPFVGPPASTHHSRGVTPATDKQSLLLFAVTAENGS
jgi:hypothetical protein